MALTSVIIWHYRKDILYVVFYYHHHPSPQPTLRVLSTIFSLIFKLDAMDTKEETERNFLLLGVAYAANIGGTGGITGRK